MNLEMIPFKRWHPVWLEQAGLAEGVPGMLLPDTAAHLECQNVFTIVRFDPYMPLACGGTYQLWPGRHAAMAAVSKDAGPHMRGVTRLSRTVLCRAKGRVELTVRQDFESGHQWARLLGFHIENPPGTLNGYGPNAEAHVAYVMFN